MGKRAALRGPLHFHELALAGHDQVQVHIRERILGIAEVGQHFSSYFADAHRRQVILQRVLLDQPLCTDHGHGVGKVGGELLADLCYAEDSLADVDLNLVMTGKGEFVEIQGTAERCAFSQEELQKFLSLGWNGIKALIKVQQDLVGALR